MNHYFLVIAISAGCGLVLGAISRTLESQPDQGPRTLNLSAAGAISDSARAHPENEETPLDGALSAIHGEMDLEDFVRLREVLSRMTGSEVCQFLDHIERTAVRRADDRLPWLFAWLQKHNPEAAMDWLRSRLALAAQDGPIRHAFEMSARGKMIAAWASADPDRAIDIARQYPESGLAAQLLSAALKTIKDRDGQAGLSLLLEFPPKVRRKPLEDVLSDWAKKDGPAAYAAVTALSDEVEREACIGVVLDAWSRKDPLAAFEQFRLTGTKAPQVVKRLISSAAAVNPQSVVDWLSTLQPPEFARWSPSVVEAWARVEPTNALEFALISGVPLGQQYEIRTRFVHDSLGRTSSSSSPSTRPLAVALREHPQTTIGWIQELPAGLDRDRVVELAIGNAKDVEQALLLLRELPPGAVPRVTRGIAARYDDQEAGRTWAESLPAGRARENAWAGLGSRADAPLDLPRGSDRDAMLSGIIFSNKGLNDSLFALDQSLKIDEARLREDVFDQVMRFVTRRSTSTILEVNQWLETADIPDNWKIRWRTELKTAEDSL